ncbi:UbiA family prenyltransferase [Desulfofustis glycolicus]|uniref:heme o synthase n=1 Tax=Desulfofustis glycolicus DSM 9705 TaxID=1121409 RepID=A0A1M5XLV4_9BACT|nr:UbiA family prenyltransferase [Desulfofustis glycolicus]SHI00632.1 protoheme IX farnesyltransferase [Desulfofustis glycolicus DSM 9705]
MNRCTTAHAGTERRAVGTVSIRLIRTAKAPLCVAVAASAIFGLLLARPVLDGRAMVLFASVFLLACGAASLNSYQDHRWDRLLRRTRDRPLASGELPLRVALWQAVLLFAAGVLLLLLLPEPQAPLLVALTVVLLYNGIYTPLKLRTSWAVLPGAVCGALPPYLGWLAGGGPFATAEIFIAMSVLALWQVPHFWLVTLNYRDDYRQLSLPALVRTMPEDKLRLIALIWILALVSAVHSLLLVRPLSPVWLPVPISALSLALAAISGYALLGSRTPGYRVLFALMNGFLLLVMALFSFGSLGR